MVVLPIYCTREHFEGATLITEKIPDDGTYNMPKHEGDLLMSDVYILVHVMLATYINFYTRHDTHDIKIVRYTFAPNHVVLS